MKKETDVLNEIQAVSRIVPSVQRINFVVLTSPDGAVAKVSMTIDNEIIVASGSSKRNPADRPNEVVGSHLALARAVTSLGHKLSRRADGLVTHADHVTQVRPIQRKHRAALEERGVLVNGQFRPDRSNRIPNGSQAQAQKAVRAAGRSRLSRPPAPRGRSQRMIAQ